MSHSLKKCTVEHENSTTQEGASTIAPFMKSRKDSGFEAFVGSISMASTPKLNSKVLNGKGAQQIEASKLILLKSTSGLKRKRADSK